MSKQPSRVVFVGNIPYDFTETQITSIFAEVGPVVNFRIVFDRDTGKPKGYGFCTFPDYETAASAVRNLNNYDVGGRTLRVDYADNADEDAKPTKPKASTPAVNQSMGQMPMGQMPMGQMPMGQMPMGQMQPPSQQIPQNQSIQQAPMPTASLMSSTDSISATMSTLNPAQLLEYLSYLKLFAMQSPDHCRLLLQANPQLVYALFQALVVMNVVDSAVMQQIIANQMAAQGFQPNIPPPQPQGDMIQEQQKVNL
jgi:cleavage stimulation factor subunit 2